MANIIGISHYKRTRDNKDGKRNCIETRMRFLNKPYHSNFEDILQDPIGVMDGLEIPKEERTNLFFDFEIIIIAAIVLQSTIFPEIHFSRAVVNLIRFIFIFSSSSCVSLFLDIFSFDAKKKCIFSVT